MKHPYHSITGTFKKNGYSSSPLVFTSVNARVTKNVELTSKVIVFPVKVLTKIFSRENRSISKYAKYFYFNVTKKGVQMRDYCLNFESCKMAARTPDSCRANSCPISYRLGIKFGCRPDIFLVPCKLNFRILDFNVAATRYSRP